MTTENDLQTDPTPENNRHADTESEGPGQQTVNHKNPDNNSLPKEEADP
jgi:hypothetical protein